MVSQLAKSRKIQLESTLARKVCIDFFTFFNTFVSNFAQIRGFPTAGKPKDSINRQKEHLSKIDYVSRETAFRYVSRETIIDDYREILLFFGK